MIKAKGTVIALSTVAALLATGGVATAVASSGGDANPVSAAADTTQTQATKSDALGKAKQGKAKHRKAMHRYAKHAPKGDGSKQLCKRAPRLDKRIDRVQRRIDGGLHARGSIDRLEKRIENAKKAGHGVIADFLNDRLTDRRELKVKLKDREAGLKKVEVWCATQDKADQGAKDKSGTSES
jgi:hypothetical protein